MSDEENCCCSMEKENEQLRAENERLKRAHFEESIKHAAAMNRAFAAERRIAALEAAGREYHAANVALTVKPRPDTGTRYRAARQKFLDLLAEADAGKPSDSEPRSGDETQERDAMHDVIMGLTSAEHFHSLPEKDSEPRSACCGAPAFYYEELKTREQIQLHLDYMCRKCWRLCELATPEPSDGER